MKRALKSLLVGIGLCLVLSSAAYAQSTNPVQSNSAGVEGVVRGNPPSQAASITFPSNNQSFTSLPIKVGGSCQTGLLVKVFSNGVFVGSAQCINSSYSLSIDLFSGQNQLVAKVFDALDQQGPDSASVLVNYTVAGYNQAAPSLTLSSIYAKRGANPGQELVWPIILSGGSPPYAISVDWGDGKNSLVSQSFAGNFDIKHTYNGPGVYSVIIKATDKDGNTAFLQLVGVGNGALSQDLGQTTGAKETVRVVYIWWPIIVAGLMILVSFWLGSRHRLERLRRQADERIQY